MFTSLLPACLLHVTVSSLVAGGSTKERINEWIHSQVVSFMERWVPPDEQHPALDAVRKLTENVKKLNLSLSDYLEPLKVHCIHTCICRSTASYIVHALSFSKSLSMLSHACANVHNVCT